MRRSSCPECGHTMIRISWSGLRVHDECKQRSYLARSGKLSTLDNKRGFFPGTVTDRVVRDWLNNDPESHLGMMPAMVEEIVDREKSALSEQETGVVRWKGPEDKGHVIKECQEAVTKIEPLLLQHVVPFEYQPDFHFEAFVMVPNHRTKRLERVVLNGFMDIIVRDNRSRWSIWDVKHTRDSEYWRQTVPQLGFYDLAVELLFGAAAYQTGLMQPLCEEALKRYQPSSDSRAQLMQRITGMANDIWADIRTPVVGSGPCGWCATKHACTKFTPVLDAKGRKRMTI